MLKVVKVKCKKCLQQSCPVVASPKGQNQCKKCVEENMLEKVSKSLQDNDSRLVAAACMHCK